MARNRQPVKPLNLDADAVKAAAAAEKARKTASRKALRDAKRAEQAPATEAAKQKTDTPEALAAKAAGRAEQDRLNRIATAKVDAEATGSTPEAILADMGCDAEGHLVPVKTAYTGPMLALVAARKSYVKGANGNPHCGDWMAVALDGLTREQVVERLGTLLFAKGITTAVNPYAGLNAGQQSMNLRNKARGAYGKGLLTDVDLATLKIA